MPPPRRDDSFRLPLAAQVGLDLGKDAKRVENALPAAVEVSTGCSVAAMLGLSQQRSYELLEAGPKRAGRRVLLPIRSRLDAGTRRGHTRGRWEADLPRPGKGPEQRRFGDLRWPPAVSDSSVGPPETGRKRRSSQGQSASRAASLATGKPDASAISAGDPAHPPGSSGRYKLTATSSYFPSCAPPNHEPFPCAHV